MQVEVVKWGNSSAVRLPASVLKDAQVARGARLELTLEGGRIVLAPARPAYALEALIAGITADNRHGEVDFGGAVGREAW